MKNQKKVVVDKKILLPFILITSLFALWGFANDITNPMVAAFKTVMEISNDNSSRTAFQTRLSTLSLSSFFFSSSPALH